MNVMIRIAGTLLAMSSVVTTCEGNTNQIDVGPGQRLDIVMDVVGDRQARCEDMGGAWNGQWTCVGVDF